MQIHLTFQGNRICLPIATGETIQGLIYRALREDTNYSNAVHNKVSSTGDRIYKMFHFSELKGKYTVEEKHLIYSSTVKLEIRSADAYLIRLLFQYFTKNKQVQLGRNTVEVVGLQLMNRAVSSQSAVIRTLSPITVYITEPDGHTKYYSPRDPEFYTMIYTNSKRKWVSHGGAEEQFEFKISPYGDGDHYLSRATRFKDTYITAWHGKFLIEGNPEVLNFLYNVGLGSKNSQGFGMFEIWDKS